jgi:hypothetical protein
MTKGLWIAAALLGGILLVSLLFLTSHAGTPPYVGTWTFPLDNTRLVFNPDGTGTYGSKPFHYHSETDHLVFDEEVFDLPMVGVSPLSKRVQWSVSDDGSRLTLLTGAGPITCPRAQP